MATKIDEGYVDLYPRINTAATRAQLARMNAMVTQSMRLMEKRMGDQITGAGGALQKSVGKVAAANGKTNILPGLAATTKTELDKTKHHIGVFAKQAAQPLGSIGRAAETVAGGIGSLGKGIQTTGLGMTRFSQSVGIAAFQTQILGYALTTFVTGPMAAFITMGVGAGVKFAMGVEQASVSLQALLPKGYNVMKLMKGLQQLAIKSPVWEIEPLQRYTAQMVAAGLQGKMILPLFKSLSNIFMTLGVAPEQASQALFALSQMMSKGKITGEELNRQWANAIPGGLRIFAEAAHVLGFKSLEKMTKASQEGKVSMNQIMLAITKVGQSGKYLEGAGHAADTLSSKWNGLKESVVAAIGNKFLIEKDGRFTFRPEVGRSIDGIKNAMLALVNAVDWSALLSRFTLLAEKITYLVNTFNGWPKAQRDEFVKWLGMLLLAGPAAIALGYLATLLSNVFAIAGATAQAIGGLTKKFMALGAAGLVLGGFTLMVVALTAALGLFILKTDEGKDMWDAFIEVVRKGWNEQIKPAIDNLVKTVKEDLIPAMDELLKSLGFDSWKEFGAFVGEELVSQILILINTMTFLVKAFTMLVWWETNFINGLKASWAWLRDDFGPGMKFMWTDMTQWLAKRWDTIQKWLRTKWHELVANFFEQLNDMRAKWNSMIGFFQNTWTSMTASLASDWDEIQRWFRDRLTDIREMWNWLTAKIREIWNSTTQWVKDKWQSVRDFFGTVIEGIKSDWNRFGTAIKSTATRIKDGVVAVFQGMLNGVKDKINGLIRLLNTAIKGINKILPGKDINAIPTLAAGGVAQSNGGSAGPILAHGLARGGKVWGAGTETSDSIHAMLSKNEFVVKAKSAKKLGFRTMKYLNEYGELPAFAEGGFAQNPRGYRPGMGYAVPGGINAIVALYNAMGGAHRPGSTYRPGDPLWHGSGLAVDFPGFNQDGVAQRLMGVRGGLLELIHSTNSRNYGVSRGREHNMGSQLWGEHKNHLHLAATPEDVSSILGGKVPNAGVGGGGGFLDSLIQRALDIALKPFAGMLPKGDDMASMSIRNIFEDAKSRLVSMFIGSSSSGGGSGMLDGWIKEAQKYVTIEWIEGLKTLIMRESGGNPNAINRTDSNAQAGTPSQGLMQTIPGTFAAHRDTRLPNNILDPVANIVAGMNYIHRRYGSLRNVQQAHAELPAKGYDNGGMLPSGQLGLNVSGKPEMVLNHAQGEALERRIAGNGDRHCEHHLYVDGKPIQVIAERVVEKNNDKILRRVTAK